MWITEVGESWLSNTLLWRGHLYAAAKGVARIYWYDYDISAGTGDMKITDYPGLSTQYQSMITACAGKVCTYINRTGATGGMIGANINGVNVLY